MGKFQVIFLLAAVNFYGSSAFWSLDTDLQLGYEIYDKSYEINALIQSISSVATRASVITSDEKTRLAVVSLNAIASQLRSYPITFFNELSSAAARRNYNEEWTISRIRSYHGNYEKTLDALQNVTGPLKGLNDVSNPSIIAVIQSSLERIQRASKEILEGAEGISKDIARARENSSLLLTPDLLGAFLDAKTKSQIISSLGETQLGFAFLLSAVRDVARLTVAHGSIHELLSRSLSRDNSTRATALNNFVNNYNRVRNNLLSSITSYRQAASTGIQNFINKVQSKYNETIVRPKFDQVQLPIIQSFADVITNQVYNQTFFQVSFDEMRDSIVDAFNAATSGGNSTHRDIILDLQRTLFVRRYSTCIDELVTEAQEASNSHTSKHAFCLNERTSGIVVVIPSTTSWLSVIRDNINFILQQLNACLNGQTTVAGRTGISECIQFNANNLPFYSSYLPRTVESNLRPIIQNTPLIFKNCVNFIATSEDGRFNEVRDKCYAEVWGTTTTEGTTEGYETTTGYNSTTTTQTTEVTDPLTTEFDTTTEPEYGSGGSEFTDLTDSYILV